MPRLLIEIDEHFYVTPDGISSSVRRGWRFNLFRQTTCDQLMASNKSKASLNVSASCEEKLFSN
jgi:hypothetical protein